MCACNIFCFGLGVCALCVFHICSSFAKLYVPGHNMERANNSSKTRRKSSGMKRKCLKQLSERHSFFYLSKSKTLFVPFFFFRLHLKSPHIKFYAPCSKINTRYFASECNLLPRTCRFSECPLLFLSRRRIVLF